VTPDADRTARAPRSAPDLGLVRRLRADVAGRMALQAATVRPAGSPGRAETARRAIAEALDAERRAALDAGSRRPGR
jgi:hypothetical protein